MTVKFETIKDFVDDILNATDNCDYDIDSLFENEKFQVMMVQLANETSEESKKLITKYESIIPEQVTPVNKLLLASMLEGLSSFLKEQGAGEEGQLGNIGRFGFLAIRMAFNRLQDDFYIIEKRKNKNENPTSKR